MRKVNTVIVTLALILAIGLGVNYVANHYGSFHYEWKTGFKDYHTYQLTGNSILNGYIRADGKISVYILTKDDFQKMKNGEPFSYYKAWENVKKVEFDAIRIPNGTISSSSRTKGKG